jgi:nucleotide-binding universal stress UspA family protein
MPAETAKFRRILMALDTASSVLPAIEAAAGLALGLNAELAGLFIEDERLLRFAGLPFAREFGFTSAGSRPLAPASIEQALRAQAEQLRRLLAATAERLSLAWTLEVVRGEVPRSVLERAGAADLLVLGRSEYAWPGASRRIDPAQRFPALAARPVAVVFDASAAALRALSIGSTLAEVTGSALIVLVAAAGPEGFKNLRQLAAQHLAARPDASYLYLHGSEPGTVLRTARSRKLGVLLWPGHIEDLTPAQLSELPCPVVVLN